MSKEKPCHCEKYEEALITIEAYLRYRSCICGLDVHAIAHDALPREKLCMVLEEFLEREKANRENEK